MKPKPEKHVKGRLTELREVCKLVKSPTLLVLDQVDSLKGSQEALSGLFSLPNVVVIGIGNDGSL